MMNFETKLKEAIKKSPFKSVEKEILKLVLSECQRSQNVNDTQGCNIVKKIIKSNDECLSYLSDDDERFNRLNEENKTLNSLLPQYWSEVQIKEWLTKEKLLSDSSVSAGRAMGVVMKKIKEQNIPVEGRTVKSAISEMLRTETE